MGWDAMRGRTTRWAATVAMAACLWFAAAVASVAQTQATISNSILTATVGGTGQLNNINLGGRFGITEVGGTAGVLLNLPRSATAPGSYVTVRIDGGTPPAGTTGVAGWDLIFGDTTDGTWLTAPTVVDGKIVASWLPNPGTTAPLVPPIQIDLVVSIIHDMVLYQFTVTNNDVQSHVVGLRFAQDYQVPGSADAPVIAPGFSNFSTEREFVSGEMPTMWMVSDSTGTHTVGGQLLPSGYAGIPSAPDRVVFGTTADVTVPRWDVTPKSGLSFSTDGSCALYYTPVDYGASEKRTYTALVGKAQATVDYGARLAAGIQGPSTLKYDGTKVNDPAKLPTDPDARLSPNPLTISGFLYNMNVISISNVQAVLNTLPTGLSLAAGETAVKTLPALAPNVEGQFQWKVNANGQGSGRLTYSVSFSADPGGQGVSVTRYVDIPALPDVPFAAALDMVSFPFVFSSTDPATALGLRTLDFDLLRWNTQYNDYEVVSAIRPGQGYWMRLQKDTLVHLQGASQVLAPTGFYEVRLQRGWNQIGTPFQMRSRWADVMVISTDAGDPEALIPLPVDVASDLQHQWILPTLYRYNSTTKVYEWDDDLRSDILPYKGYWVKSLRDNISLLLPVPTTRAARLVGATRSALGVGGWKQRIAVSDGVHVDDRNYLGVSPTASDAYDLHDVEKPPASRGGITVGFVRADWGMRSGIYAQDIQSSSNGKKQWQFRVSGQPNTNVTLSWPDMASLPRNVELYVVDSATGVRQSMRQRASLRINTGDSGTRSVTFEMEPKTTGGMLRITNATVRSRAGGGTATIGFSASQDATVRVRIVRADGANVRDLVSRDVTSGTAVNVTWDYRDNRGASVPAGLYNIVITGVTADGQSATQTVPHLVIR